MANYLYGLFERNTTILPPAHVWPGGGVPTIEILKDAVWSYPAETPGVYGARGNPNAVWHQLPDDSYAYESAMCDGRLLTRAETELWVKQMLDSLPTNMEHVAVALHLAPGEYKVAKFLVDKNKTHVRAVLANAGMNPKNMAIELCASTPYWTPDSILDKARNDSIYERNETSNLMLSAMTNGAPVGQNPPMQIKTFKNMSEHMWLGEMEGNVLLFKLAPKPRNSDGLDWGDIGLELLFGVLEDLVDAALPG